MSNFVFEVTRDFTSKAYGKIGQSGWRVTKTGAAEMLRAGNWVLVPDATRDALAMFALQTLQDAYAGAKTASEAVGSFDKKLDAYIDGTVGTRATSWESVAREIITLALVKRDPEFKKLEAATRSARVSAAMAKNMENVKFLAMVNEEIAKRAEEAAKLKAMADSVSFD